MIPASPNTVVTIPYKQTKVTKWKNIFRLNLNKKIQVVDIHNSYLNHNDTERLRKNDEKRQMANFVKHWHSQKGCVWTKVQNK